ncbi:MAG TPA: FecR domain-containing protein [Rhodocyclaceae bacterium]
MPSGRASIRCFYLLLLTAGLLVGLPARGEPGNPAPSDTGQAFAEVWRIYGEVFATVKGARRRIALGDSIAVGDSVKTSPGGEVVLRTRDRGILALRPSSEFSAEGYSAQERDDDRQYLKLLKGSLRVVSGWIAHRNPDRYKLTTPTAALGVRGTDHEAYVLDIESARGDNLPGTYDKVNRGATVLEASGGQVVIDAGKVGFARDPESVKIRTRALMTLLLPVLLDKVPDFFVPGRFDEEIDRLAGNDASGSGISPTTKPVASKSRTTRPPLPAGCVPAKVGRQWLAVLDDAMTRRDADTLLALFAPEATAEAVVRQANGESSTQTFGPEDFVRSTLRSLAGLTDYQQERMGIASEPQVKPVGKECPRMTVRSEVLESGRSNGQPYRFHSTEEYVLERRNGKWLAIAARSTQK